MVSHPQREAFSINGGTPKWMNFSLEHLIYEWIWGVPLFMEPPHMNSPQKNPPRVLLGSHSHPGPAAESADARGTWPGHEGGLQSAPGAGPQWK